VPEIEMILVPFGTFGCETYMPTKRPVALPTLALELEPVTLTVVTQRPSEVDATVLSQCGTMIALRTTSPQDRSRVSAAFPDDLGGLVDLLPSLRTGEALFVGEAMFVPSRVRVRLTKASGSGTDPKATELWKAGPRPARTMYEKALQNWRRQVKG
jgi:hypothetical protein